MKFFKHIRYLACVPLILGLTQCDVIEAIHNPQPKDGPYSYDLILKMSPKAEAALKSAEYINADAFYYAHAKPGATAKTDALHRVYLGQEKWNFAASARKLHMYGSPLDAKLLPQTIEGEPFVLVTVVGANTPDNVVNCHFFLGPIREARQKSPEMHCELDTEQYWDDLAASAAASSSQSASK